MLPCLCEDVKLGCWQTCFLLDGEKLPAEGAKDLGEGC